MLDPADLRTRVEFRTSYPLVSVIHLPTGTIAHCSSTVSELLNRSRAVAALTMTIEAGTMRCGLDLAHQLTGITIDSVRTRRRDVDQDPHGEPNHARRPKKRKTVDPLPPTFHVFEDA